MVQQYTETILSHNFMVREIAVRWNTLRINTELMYAKLVKLGFNCENGEITIREAK